MTVTILTVLYELKIVRKKVMDLRFAPYNPRTISDSELAKLEKSLDEEQGFGYVDPLIWNKRTGNVVGGNQRLKIIKKSRGTEVDVVEVDLPLDKEKALNLALNRISGDWDNQLLRSILEELKTTEVPMDLTGFDVQELENLRTSLPEFDPEKEWEGMPDFQQDELTHRTLLVHFKDDGAVQDFSRLVNQKIGETTKFIWYPYQPREDAPVEP